MKTDAFFALHPNESGRAPSAAPVFIIGSYRSGTSALTWALGQHPAMFPLEETNWLYRLGLYLDCLYAFGTSNGPNTHLSSMDMTKRHFYRSFGAMAHSFILQNRVQYLRASLKVHLQKNNLPVAGLNKLTKMEDFVEFTQDNDLFSLIRNKQDKKERWVDGTPENSHFVYCLNMMFPNAKFIFMIRNPIRVAHSLMNFATVSGRASNYEEENAYNQWYALTESGYHALKAFGTDKVLLIQQEDLAAQKEATICQCLSFLEEEYDVNCLKPLQANVNSSTFDRSQIDFSIDKGMKSKRPYVQKACLFYHEIVTQSFNQAKGSLQYYRLLRNRYLEQAKYFY